MESITGIGNASDDETEKVKLGCMKEFRDIIIQIPILKAN